MQASSKKPSKKKNLSNPFDKNCADVLAASDRGSHVEQAAGEVDYSRRGRTKSMGELAGRNLKIIERLSLTLSGRTSNGERQK